MKHLKTLPVKGTDTAALFGTEKIGKILFKVAAAVFCFHNVVGVGTDLMHFVL